MSRLAVSIALLLAAVLPAAAQNVAGIVRAPEGGGLAGARVTLFGPDTTFFREARAGADGAFGFTGIPAGRYTLGASLTSRAYVQMQIDVGATEVRRDFTLGPEAETGRWTLHGDPGERLGGTNSGVLLLSGQLLWCHDTRDPVRFDPVTNALTRPAQSPRLQGCHAVGVLPDGRVLYVGGADREFYGPGTRQVKTYDPVANTWTVQPEISADRWYPTMVPLPDGTFLVAGGGGRNNPIRVRTTEVFDPVTMRSAPAGDLALGNEVSPVVLLYTGEVLMTHRPPQLFDPATRQWRRAADFVQAGRSSAGEHADHEVILTKSGEVIAIGYTARNGAPYRSLVERYDPATDRWRLGANRAPARSQASLVLLPDERILVLGGYKEQASDPTPVNAWGFMKLTELYDPAADAWRRVADLNVAREYHALPILVPDGRVVVVGGEGSPGNEPAASVIEAYSPPYLFRGVRPVVSGLSGTAFRRGERIAFRVARTAAPTRIVLMGTSASTHFMESGNARFLDLPFVQTGADLVATLPDDGVRLPPGQYVLFAMTDDVPSVGRIVRVLPGGVVSAEWDPGAGAPMTLTSTPTVFGGATTLTFTLPREALVHLDVFDTLGRRVETLLAERRGAGVHSLRWDALRVPTGAYYVRLTADDLAKTQPVFRVR